jgi:aryl-alcohol dehydrogenase-like predicted oxidoreductase
MQRREFLKAAAVAGVAAVATANLRTEAQAGSTGSTGSGALAWSTDMQYRTLGRTGEKVSVIGLGGYHIGVQPDPAESVRLIRTAIDRGINFMDNSWDYNDGASEQRMGDALKDGYRKKVLLMTKIDGRSKASFNSQLEQSLTRLQTDVIDLMQFHEIIRFEDPDRIFAAGGALEGALEAKQAGKIRYIGFTGHKDPLIHLRTFEVAKQHGFHFDTVQMPINVMDAHFRSFAKQVIPVAEAEGTGVLAMKVLAGRSILQSKTATAMECLQYALAQKVAVVITGMDSAPILDQAFAAVKAGPLSETQMAAVLAKTHDAAMTGVYEPFKTTSRVDGSARRPDWLG